MAGARTLVVVITRGLDDERASVAWSVSKGAIASGLDLIVFLTASGVEWVRKGAFEQARPNPLDPPVSEMIQHCLDHGAKIFVCPPCAGVRGVTEKDLIDGAVISGSGAIHGPIKEGAATLCF